MTARRYFSRQIRIGEASVDEQEAWLFLKTAMPPRWKAILFFMSKMRICSPIL